MPFKSEAQRKWMHINLPDTAKRWEKEYPIGKDRLISRVKPKKK